jgi:hypothetical protein
MVIFGLVIPIIISLIFGSLRPLVAIYDWPAMSYRVPPESAIFTGCIVGGFLGFKAGGIWHNDNDRSCLQCLLVPISLLTLGSLAVLFFL